MSERKPDRTYVLTERQFLSALIAGAVQQRLVPQDLGERLERAQCEHVQNGVVLRVWEAEPQRTTKELVAGLRGYASELPAAVPTEKEIEAWTQEQRQEVEIWLDVLHARAAPIAGMVQPELPPVPEVLKAAKGRKIPRRTRELSEEQLAKAEAERLRNGM